LFDLIPAFGVDDVDVRTDEFDPERDLYRGCMEILERRREGGEGSVSALFVVFACHNGFDDGA
jgi:hypothetical protein